MEVDPMYLDRLFQWIERHLPEMSGSFNEPATLDAINAVEAKIGVAFPEELRALYLRYNGQDESRTVSGLFYGLHFNSLELMMNEWENWVDVSKDTYLQTMDDLKSYKPGFVKHDYANPKWIPLSKDGGGNNFGLDFDPGPNGTTGQIINFGRDEDIKYVMADSFANFLKWYVEQLESGNFHITIEDGASRFNTGRPRTEHFLDSIKVLFK